MKILQIPKNLETRKVEIERKLVILNGEKESLLNGRAAVELDDDKLDKYLDLEDDLGDLEHELYFLEHNAKWGRYFKDDYDKMIGDEKEYEKLLFKVIKSMKYAPFYHRIWGKYYLDIFRERHNNLTNFFSKFLAADLYQKVTIHGEAFFVGQFEIDNDTGEFEPDEKTGEAIKDELFSIYIESAEKVRTEKKMSKTKFNRLHLGEFDRRNPNKNIKWTSEHELYKIVKRHLKSKTKVIKQGSPSFLGRQRYDIWIPKYNIAIEYDGEQHFNPDSYYAKKGDFEKQMKLDELKNKLSEANGVSLLRVRNGYDENEVYEFIDKKLQ